MNYFSMFSGIGGFENGIKRALDNKQSSEVEQDREGRNGDTDEQKVRVLSSTKPALCVGHSEIDPYAEQVYQKQFGGKNYGDATNINTDELPDFDMLCGGFPCQAFSIAGKRRGFDDTRGTLFFEIARIAKAKQPRILFLENVKGLLNHDKGNTFTKTLQTLDELGYDVQWQVLNSKHFGVPQNRERVFIIGHLRGTRRPEVFPITRSNNIYLKEITENVSDAQRIYTTDCANASCLTKGYGKGDNRPNNKSCRTRIHNGNTIRRLTPTECERLQGFPDGFTKGLSDTQRYKCLGNAVTVNVIEAIMRRLL